MRKVPGPFLARFSRFWELNAIRRNDLNETYIRLHEKYGHKAFSRILNPLAADLRLHALGPVVRIAPNRYSFNTPEALKTIYTSNENPKSEPFLAKLMDLKLKGRIDQGSIFSSCGSNIIAGSDTTAITLSAAFYYIYQNPIVLKKLRDEIDAHERAGLLSNPAGFTEAQQMPYLQGIIKETLRMHPAVAQMLPREVPKNGVVLNGYHFPEKVCKKDTIHHRSCCRY